VITIASDCPAIDTLQRVCPVPGKLDVNDPLSVRYRILPRSSSARHLD
jgi:hypothetical protein